MKEPNLRITQGYHHKKPKKIIIKPSTYYNSDLSTTPDKYDKYDKDELYKFKNLISIISDKIDLVYINPSELTSVERTEIFNGKIIFNSEEADYVIINDSTKLNKVRNLSSTKKDCAHIKYGMYKRIKSNEDIDQIKEFLTVNNLSFVIIDLDDWRIIPLENIIASFQSTDIEIFAVAKSIDEVETLFTVLELGVDGVVISAENAEEIKQINGIINKKTFEIKSAVIKEIIDVGMGERVCIDTVSMLDKGEGMLVGNRSNFLFLVHNESIGSSFTSPRPFRVNAGAVHCYTLIPDGTTNYLSELESGSQVFIVNEKGVARVVVVGRAKIESRPLKLFKASINEDEYGSIIVQNAETIRFLRKDGSILPVTHAKVGDSVLVFSKPPTGRHFGMEVSNEYILEK